MIIYQIYPRSFYDSNDDGIGDLLGIEKKLSYIKSLGVDAIWISPFFKSPMKDFGYDVSNYREVDPIFGTIDDFKSLLKSAKDLGLGIIVDMVISHTSDQHPWFKDHPDWYLWADPKADGSAPNNWVSVFGGSAWQWDSEKRKYYFHSFLSSQPDLNMHNPAVQDAVLGEMKFWLDLGVAGFRFDACNHIFQDLKLRNNPPRKDNESALHPYGFQVHKYDQGRPEMSSFLSKVRELLDEYGAYSLAEVGGDNSIKLMGKYTRAGKLHSAYSFAMMKNDSSDSYLRGVIASMEENLKHPGTPCYAMSNHDKPRVATRWQNGRDRDQTAKEMIALLFSMRGDICMYQGEELGLPQSEVPFENIKDPFGITFWPKFKGRDGCRTPMPWSPTGGFSSIDAWLPMDPNHLNLSVEAQEADQFSMLNFTRTLIRLRKMHPVLSHGSIELIDAPEGILAFRRTHAGKSILGYFNLSDASQMLFTDVPKDILAHQNVTSSLTFRAMNYIIGVSGFCLLEM